MKTTLFAACSLGLLAAALAAPADASEGAFKYRKAVMSAIGGHTNALAAIVRGDVQAAQDVKPHAVAIEALSKMAPAIFPQGSATADSEALPAIWEKPDDFKKAMTAFQTAAASLAKAADGDVKAVAAALGEMGKTCKGCHDNFRKKK